MNTTYENSSNELNEMLNESALEQKKDGLNENEKQVLATVEAILESKTLYIENTENALVLSDDTNAKVFEAVAHTSLSVYNDILEMEDMEDELDATKNGYIGWPACLNASTIPAQYSSSTSNSRLKRNLNNSGEI